MRALTAIIPTFFAALLLAGCGGGSGSGSLPANSGGDSGGTTQTQSENAIAGANALGSPMKNISNFNQGISPASLGRVTQATTGACNNNFEFFSPDKAADANSTEAIWFYDAQCTQMARDNVRKYTISGSSEIVNHTENLYALGNSTPIATKIAMGTIGKATFDANGFPKVDGGFNRASTNQLAIGGVKTIDSADEIVMLPASAGVNQFCSDAAGYNATGIANLGETFGWQGGVLTGGTRTVNPDGSVTWNATHAGAVYKGAIGTLSLAIGTQNLACPISTPMVTLAGGTQLGTYSIPIVATYKQGLLTSLTVSNATLANGNTLNVTTNSGVLPSSMQFISGILSNGATTIATFNTDAFGNGTVTISSSGRQYVITDWHVIH
ncbi:MAG: hypothetical protein M3126_05165 [Candidatus Eremiobacteraeota bacterium]|nr:hypothetical protein [Candidatus Eremiobacteraeota bacterium]